MGNKNFITFLLFLTACSAVQPVMAEINSYEECVKAGNIIKKSLPQQCVTKDGKIFYDTSNQLRMNQGKICNDDCGDGKCAEIVCMGQGCPCPENAENCAKDCAR